MGSRKVMIAVLGLIEEQGRVLLVQEAKARLRGLWNVPGGRLEEGESLVQALEREVLEETGLIVRPTSLLHVDQLIADGSGQPNRLRLAFRARLHGGRLKTRADEHSLRAGWFSRDELPELALRTQGLLALTEDRPPCLPIDRVHLIGDEERERERRERAARPHRD